MNCNFVPAENATAIANIRLPPTNHPPTQFSQRTLWSPDPRSEHSGFATESRSPVPPTEPQPMTQRSRSIINWWRSWLSKWVSSTVACLPAHSAVPVLSYGCSTLVTTYMYTHTRTHTHTPWNPFAQILDPVSCVHLDAVVDLDTATLIATTSMRTHAGVYIWTSWCEKNHYPPPCSYPWRPPT